MCNGNIFVLKKFDKLRDAANIRRTLILQPVTGTTRLCWRTITRKRRRNLRTGKKHWNSLCKIWGRINGKAPYQRWSSLCTFRGFNRTCWTPVCHAYIELYAGYFCFSLFLHYCIHRRNARMFILRYYSLLRNTRPHVVRTVCQVAMELCKTVQCTQRPEFDELASTLLLKSTHTNKGIRNDAQRALDSMVTHLPPAICIRILASEHGAK